MQSKILVVEDNINELQLLERILMKEGYAVTHKLDGEKALSFLEKTVPDLVILDIVLPGIDGFEVCKRIRQYTHLARLPILFYSAVKTVDEKLLALEMGASDFLPKSAEDRELLIRIRNLLDIKKKIDQQIKFSFFDDITNVYSRYYFEHRMQDECKRSQRYKRDFSCAIIDVDNFKTINDSLGYSTGNVVLKKVAGIVNDNIRSMDTVCRYGPDEFGVLFPETDLRGAYLASERVRQNMATYTQDKNECPVNLTISCGVSSFQKEIKDENELVKQADIALKKAKGAGRNQTIAYSDQLGDSYLDTPHT